MFWPYKESISHYSSQYNDATTLLSMPSIRKMKKSSNGDLKWGVKISTEHALPKKSNFTKMNTWKVTASQHSIEQKVLSSTGSQAHWLQPWFSTWSCTGGVRLIGNCIWRSKRVTPLWIDFNALPELFHFAQNQRYKSIPTTIGPVRLVRLNLTAETSKYQGGVKSQGDKCSYKGNESFAATQR